MDGVGRGSDRSGGKPSCQDRMVALVVGELLVDELPRGRRPGGAPYNFAQHLHRMGHTVQFVSATGDDEIGIELRSAVRAAGLDPSFIQIDPHHPTGRVQVELDAHGVPEYTILEDTAYDHVDWDGCAPSDPLPDLIYFGSLVQRTDAGRERLQNLLRRIPAGTVRFYDVNFRAGCDRKEIVAPSLEQTDVLKLNGEELGQIARMVGIEGGEKEQVFQLMDRFSIRQTAVTHGARGSSLYGGGTSTYWPPGPLRREEIIDTVGAGDAFAAALADGLHAGLAPHDILQRATKLAEFVCTQSGAVPEKDFIYQALEEEG